MWLNLKLIPALILSIPAVAMGANTITFDGVGKGNDYELTYDNQKEDVFVGSLLFNSGNSKSEMTTFCVDLTHFISNGQTYAVNAIQTGTLPNKNPYKLAGDILDAGAGTLTDANHAAAMQIAIWKAVYGNSFSLTGVSSTVDNLEQVYYSAGLKTNKNAVYLQETQNYGQSQITTTPEPATMAILGVGAFGLFFRKRKS